MSPTDPTPAARILAGAFNFRDLGGLPTADGRVVRSGRVFRSNCFVELEPDDVELLRSQVRVATVIDLRGPAEAEREGPDPLDQLAIRRERLPLLDEQVTTPGDISDLLSRYRGYLTGAAKNIVRALGIIADEENHPIVFHCTTGKDRTGVVAALLLGCLGVPPEIIAGDYSASVTDPKEFFAFVCRRAGLSGFTEGHPLLEADPKTMTAFLEGLEADHGGAATWALSAGLPPETLDRLRHVLLV